MSLIINTDLGWGLYYRGAYDEAIEQLLRTLDLDSNFAVAHLILGLAYAQSDRSMPRCPAFNARSICRRRPVDAGRRRPRVRLCAAGSQDGRPERPAAPRNAVRRPLLAGLLFAMVLAGLDDRSHRLRAAGTGPRGAVRSLDLSQRGPDIRPAPRRSEIQSCRARGRLSGAGRPDHERRRSPLAAPRQHSPGTTGGLEAGGGGRGAPERRAPRHRQSPGKVLEAAPPIMLSLTPAGGPITSTHGLPAHETNHATGTCRTAPPGLDDRGRRSAASRSDCGGDIEFAALYGETSPLLFGLVMHILRIEPQRKRRWLTSTRRLPTMPVRRAPDTILRRG